ncbi:MAG TPA: acyl-CoA desaturase [bacterium]
MGAATPRLKFGGDNGFQIELRRRVDEFFSRTGKSRRDALQMYIKAGVVLLWFAVSYALLVFVAQAWWQALPLAVMVGMATAAIGFNIMHDGGHGAFSRHPWVNHLFAMSLDMIGGSSVLWRWQHGVYHHTYVNITGNDADIDLGGLGRLTPHQRRLWFHRVQHWYIWLLYGVMAIKWQLYDDFRELIVSRCGANRIPRLTPRELLIFFVGKALFLSLAFGVPMLLHPFWAVAIFYAVAAIVLGLVLSVVFQLAHCVEEAEFPMPDAVTRRMERAWAIHQVETTVNFSRGNRVVSWLLGGLNFQIEHHLFPRVCHTHYAAMAKLVEETCRDFGIRYNEHKSLWSGIASHFRWLRQMGMTTPTA